MIRTRKAWLAFALSATLASSLAARTAQAAGTTIDERLDATAGEPLEVVNRAGKVVVTGWSKDQVVVTGTLGENTVGLDVVRDGNRIYVAVKYPEGGSGGEQDSELYISMPAASELVVRGVSANVEVREVRAAQRLQTVSGDVSVTAFSADLELHTVSGDMTITGQQEQGILNATSVSGDVDASDIAGDVEATSVSGDVDVVAGLLGRAQIKSTSGDIDVSAEVAQAGRLIVESLSGDVALVLRDEADVALEAESFSGDVRNCFDAPVEGGPGAGQSLRMNRGAADRSVRVTSFSGDVGVCDR